MMDNNQEEKQPVSNPVRDAMLEYNKLNTDLIKDAFMMLGNGYNQMPEQAFVQTFLPIFIGDREATKEDLDAWDEVIGVPFNGLNLIDQYGQIVAVVPPLRDRAGVLNTGKGEDNDIALMLADHDSTANLAPAPAQMGLAADLIDKYVSTAEPNTFLQDQWVEFLSRYKPKDAVVKVNATKVVDEDLEWD